MGLLRSGTSWLERFVKTWNIKHKRTSCWWRARCCVWHSVVTVKCWQLVLTMERSRCKYVCIICSSGNHVFVKVPSAEFWPIGLKWSLSVLLCDTHEIKNSSDYLTQEHVLLLWVSHVTFCKQRNKIVTHKKKSFLLPFDLCNFMYEFFSWLHFTLSPFSHFFLSSYSFSSSIRYTGMEDSVRSVSASLWEGAH